MPGIQGVEVLRILKEKQPAVEVIIATGCGSMGTAVEALRYGAFDYIQKPIVNFDQDLLKVVGEAISSRREKLGSRRPGTTPESELVERRILLMDQLTEIAALANRQGREEAALEHVEDLLFRNFGAGAGVVFSVPPAPQEPAPIHTWGISGTPSLRELRWSDSAVLKAVRKGQLGTFHLDALPALSSELNGWREVVCLPLVFGGEAWGGLLLFFAEKLPPHLEGPTERHPFQLLAPALTSIFAASLRHPLSQH
jgi:CheY-like chemotaxis protein